MAVLYVTATPIGNLNDFSPRGVETLKEADLIVLNKCDLLDALEREEEVSWLRNRYIQADVIAVSAKTGENLDALCLALRNGRASMHHPEIDYDADNLQNAMGSLSEYYLQYRALVCCEDFDGNEYLTDLAYKIRAAISGLGNEVPHFKLLAWAPEGDFGKADILGTDRPVELPHRFSQPCTDIAVIPNTSAACPDEVLDRIVEDAVKEVSERYQLELTMFKKDHFSLGE